MDALRRMAAVLALVAGTAALGGGCMASSEDPATPADEAPAVTDDKTNTDASAATDENTGEGRQPWWGWGGWGGVWNPWFRPWWGGYGWGWGAPVVPVWGGWGWGVWNPWFRPWWGRPWWGGFGWW